MNNETPKKRVNPIARRKKNILKEDKQSDSLCSTSIALTPITDTTYTITGTTYTMVCSNGEYCSCSWIGLGWAILTHRLRHLWNDHKWMD